MNSYMGNGSTTPMTSSTANYGSDQGTIDKIKSDNAKSAQNAGKSGMAGTSQSFSSGTVDSDQNRLNEIKKQNQTSQQNAGKSGSNTSLS